MVASTENKKCIFVIGPTASGKSAWALEEASRHDGSVVNIDSIQFYKDLIVGSAAPTEAEKKIVPHHLYSYVEAPQEMTAGNYIKDFYALIEQSVRFPLFIVGGTGFYIQALQKGMFDVEPVPPEFRKKIEDELHNGGVDALYAELQAHDPQTKIHINDHYRLVRAIEIIRFTGDVPSRLKAAPESNKNELPFPFMQAGFNFEKHVFEKRVRERTHKMIEGGIIDEVQFFLKQNLQDWAPLSSVGYKETLQFLLENKNKDWLAEAINTSTMQLIKKQKTWFKRDSAILWSNQSEAVSQFLS